jgi:hypothetical protein
MGQVEEDVLQFETTEGQPDQRREEGEFTMTRDERDPVFRPRSPRLLSAATTPAKPPPNTRIFAILNS